MNQESKIRILLMDENPEDQLVIIDSCNEFAYEVLVVASNENPMDRVFDSVPQLIIIHEDFNQGRGRYIASQIKMDAIMQYIPIILLVSSKQIFVRRREAIADVFFERSEGLDRIGWTCKQVMESSRNELDVNPLTHLPGTRSSISCLETKVAAREDFAVCCLDLTDLEAFNSVYGYARGDELLTRFGALLRDVVGKCADDQAYLGHLGGDDFMILVKPSEAVAVCERIMTRFNEIVVNFYDAEDKLKGFIIKRNSDGMLTQYPIMSLMASVVYSEGIPMLEMTRIGQVAGELKTIMKVQGVSCYIEYKHPKGQKNLSLTGLPLTVHVPGKNEKINVRNVAQANNRYDDFVEKIIKQKKIFSVYQPIVDFANQTVIGYEALTRSSEEAYKNPEHLFAMAREFGLIREVDKLCVDMALSSAQKLEKDRKLFLNINHETLMDVHFMRDFFDKKGNIGFKNIVIEVTEQSLLRSFESIKKALLELQEQGVSIAIDDVGGGAVSLRDVAVLKPDYIKFDRSLVRQIDTNITKQQILISMLMFSSGIQAIVLAEGVETKPELDTLIACGVRLGQGFFFKHPGAAFPEIEKH